MRFARGKLIGESIDSICIKNLLLHGDRLPKRNLLLSFGNKLAMRNGNWKLVSIKSQDKTMIELFDLEKNLSKKNDLSRKVTELVNEMILKLDNWKVDVRAGISQISG